MAEIMTITCLYVVLHPIQRCIRPNSPRLGGECKYGMDSAVQAVVLLWYYCVSHDLWLLECCHPIKLISNLKARWWVGWMGWTRD